MCCNKILFKRIRQNFFLLKAKYVKALKKKIVVKAADAKPITLTLIPDQNEEMAIGTSDGCISQETKGKQGHTPGGSIYEIWAGVGQPQRRLRCPWASHTRCCNL